MSENRDLTLPARFWINVEPGRTDDECWFWTGSKNNSGYGTFRIGGRTSGSTVTAHVWAYETSIGPVPDGLDLDHMCHNADETCTGGWDCPHRACVNPAHLEPVTRRENSLRGRSVHRAKTHCRRGHPYAGDNLYVHNGRRHCRACRAQNDADRREKKVRG